jgi:hypothetical protein
VVNINRLYFNVEAAQTAREDVAVGMRAILAEMGKPSIAILAR